MRPFILVIFAALLAGCAAPLTQPPATPSPAPALTPTATTPPRLWLAPAVPLSLQQAARQSGLTLAENAAEAAFKIQPDPQGRAVWVYALAAAFPSLQDEASLEETQALFCEGGAPLLVSAETSAAMQTLFGCPPAASVQIVAPEALSDSLWANPAARAILPFEQIQPRMKILAVEGQSPLWKSFDLQSYPLQLAFSTAGLSVPLTNRDPQKLTTVVMTGVTALVRATAAKMEKNGSLYPGEKIRSWLQEADIAHISNEIPFAVDCPPPAPYQTRLIFCSDPKYIALLEDVGADVIELTGNHFEDWGKEATLHTLGMYRERGWPYFGGGSDLADSQKPALLERNGVKFAFIGCNPAGPQVAWARADGWPGAAPCDDFTWMETEIRRLTAEGYRVIATFQYFEYYSSDPRPWQMRDFRRMADAGAVIVSGSQAHYAQAMEFYGNAFVHYGLGNLFFDQMGYTNPSSGLRTNNTRREFLDRHVFYDGQYINTELLTAMLEDYAQPRPMTSEERQAFLEEYFLASGWRPE